MGKLFASASATVLALTILASSLCAAPAFAQTAPDRPLVPGERLVRDTGWVRQPDLSIAQRRALDISHVRLSHGPWGTVVRVFTKGDFQREAGRGELGQALVALVVRRRSGGAAAVIATRRPYRASTLRGDRLGTLMARVVGGGREVVFLVLAPPGQTVDIASVEVKTVTVVPRGRGGLGRRISLLATASAVDSLAVRLPAMPALLGMPPLATASQFSISAIVCPILRYLKAAFGPYFGGIFDSLLAAFGCNPPPPPPPPPSPPMTESGQGSSSSNDDDERRKSKKGKCAGLRGEEKQQCKTGSPPPTT